MIIYRKFINFAQTRLKTADDYLYTYNILANSIKEAEQITIINWTFEIAAEWFGFNPIQVDNVFLSIKEYPRLFRTYANILMAIERYYCYDSTKLKSEDIWDFKLVGSNMSLDDKKDFINRTANGQLFELNKSYTDQKNREEVTVIGPAYLDYVLNYLVVPYLINVLRFEDIYNLVTQIPDFPKTRALIIKKEDSKNQPAYEDLDLPLHPFWNAPVINEAGNIVGYRNLTRGVSFTEPDFYLANPSTDYEEKESIEYISVIEGGGKNINATPEDLYNLYIDFAAEQSRGDLEGLGKRSSLLNSDKGSARKNIENKDAYTSKLPSQDERTAAGYSDYMSIESSLGAQARPIDFEYYRKNLTPKNFITEDKSNQAGYEVKAAGTVSGADNTSGPQWNGQRLDMSEFSFIFGDNTDFMDPLVSGFGYDGKLKTSRLTNWTYQEYDFESHERRKIRLRNSYSTDEPLEMPDQPGVTRSTPPNQGKVNLYRSTTYDLLRQEIASQSAQGRQTPTFYVDPALKNYDVQRTTPFAQIRTADWDSAEFKGSDIKFSGKKELLPPGQVAPDNIAWDGYYRFHKGVDIYPVGPTKPAQGTSLKEGAEYVDLIPVYAPYDMTYSGSDSGLFNPEWMFSGNMMYDYRANQDDKKHFFERYVVPDLISRKAQGIDSIYYEFIDPYKQKKWLVFKNINSNVPETGKDINAAGLRGAWEIDSGPFAGLTFAVYHMSYMIAVEDIIWAVERRQSGRKVVEREIDLDWLTNPSNFEDINFAYSQVTASDKLKTTPLLEIGQSVSAGDFIGFIGRTGFDNGSKVPEHAHLELCKRLDSFKDLGIQSFPGNGAHVTLKGSIAWRVDPNPILEKGATINKEILDNYYQSESFKQTMINRANRDSDKALFEKPASP